MYAHLIEYRADTAPLGTWLSTCHLNVRIKGPAYDKYDSGNDMP